MFGLTQFVMMQHTCKPGMDEAEACYLPLDQPWLNPWIEVSDSKDARFTFVRANSANITDELRAYKCVWTGIDGMCGRGNNNSWASEGAVCNDSIGNSLGAWYHMADLVYPEDCRWTISSSSKTAKYIREVGPRQIRVLRL